MALESATYINQLREDAPSGLDPKSQGDDHLRLIKGALKRTFPKIDAEVTATPAQLNALSGAGVLCPPGAIMMWAFNEGSIPAGWGTCDGITRLNDGRLSPDLRGMFVRGVSPSIPLGTRGGAETHTHTVSVAGTALTVAQMPSHRHRYMSSTSNSWNVASSCTPAHGGDSPPNNKAAGFAGPYTGRYNVSAAYSYFDLDGRTQVPSIENTGSGEAHTHTGTAAAGANIPPFYALLYIIKL